MLTVTRKERKRAQEGEEKGIERKRRITQRKWVAGE
jgi:hypothetical protein